MSLSDQVIAIFAATNGYADLVSVDKMAKWQVDLLKFMESSYPEIGRAIAEKKTLTDDIRADLTKALDVFRNTWQA
jgi:F-type H+-transporting ATPase subunit alpha